MPKFTIPLDVPMNKRDEFAKNFEMATAGSGRLMLFAGDQKIEHLNDDFYGEGIALDNSRPQHLFDIASKARIGVFAAQFGLIARYAGDYDKKIPYMVKMNSKSPIVKTEQQDPISKAHTGIWDLIRFKEETDLNIIAIGYTIYLGSEYEAEMLVEAAHLIREAHRQGMFAALWLYPRGKGVTNELDPHLIAGAAGVATCLGADFVKVNPPRQDGQIKAELLKEAVAAAGNTKLLCAGGASGEVRHFLQTLHDQIHIAGAQGNATGRNIHQKPLDEAIRFCNAIYAITVEDKSVDEAMQIYQG